MLWGGNPYGRCQRSAFNLGEGGSFTMARKQCVLGVNASWERESRPECQDLSPTHGRGPVTLAHEKRCKVNIEQMTAPGG